MIERRTTGRRTYLGLLVLLCAFGGAIDAALADMRLRSGDLWLVVASRPSPSRAVDFASDFARHVSPPMVVLTRNGTYAVIAGSLERDRAESNLSMLKALRLIPSDAFLSPGEHFDALVWPSRSDLRVGDVVESSTLRRTVADIQRGLQRLGFYRSRVDGLIGRGTRGAYRAFERKFGRSGHRVDGWSPSQVVAAVAERSDPTRLAAASQERARRKEARRQAKREERRRREWRAARAAGFTSVAMMERARAAGFANARDYDDAEQAGFERAEVWQAATAAGFSNARDYAAARAGGFERSGDYENAKAAGFERAAQYREAKAAGFNDRAEVEAAREAGFTRAAAYRAFIASGFDDPIQYEAARSQGYSSRTAAIAGRRERLVVLQEATRTLLQDAALFVRTRSDPATAYEIATRVAGVTEALEAEFDTSFQGLGLAHARLEDSANALAALLADMPDFSAFRLDREAARAAVLEREVDAERTRLAALDRGLKAWMVLNLLDPRVPTIKELVDDLAQGASTQDLAALRKLARETDEAVTAAGVSADVARLGEPPAAVSATPALRRVVDDGVRGVFTPTAATRFLLDGPDDEIVLIYNTRGAPHIVRDLAGRLRFQDGRAVLCIAGERPARLSERVLRQVFARLERPAALDIEAQCAEGNVGEVDLVLTRRATFLAGDKAFAQLVLEQIEEGRLRRYEDVSDAALGEAAERERELVSRLEGELAAGAGDGYAALIVASGGTEPSDAEGRDACLAGASVAQATDFHLAALERATADLALPQTKSRVTMSPDEAFFAVQRERCGVLYAAIEDLSRLARGLDDNGLRYEIAPFRVEQALLDRRNEALAAKADAARERSARAEAARARREQEADAAKRIAAARAREAREREAARQAREEERKVALAKREADEARARREAEAEQRRRDSERRRVERERAEAEAKAERELAAKRARIEAASLAARTRAFRAENGTRATARLNRVRAMAEALFADRSSAAFADARRYLPELVAFDAASKRDLWRHEDLTVAVDEFGDATWHDRKVEAVVVRLEPKLVNAELGAYRTPCFAIAVLFDDEFDRLRAVHEGRCEDEAAIDTWQAAHGFQSRWNAGPRAGN